MSSFVVLPLLLPLFTAVILVFFNSFIRVQRWLSLISGFINIVSTCVLLLYVQQYGIQVLEMGGWAAPYGIVFVADSFALLLVITALIVQVCCLLYAFQTIGPERERHYFYPFVQFLMVGVIGSFLTGDVFNLFVCFEVMLLSSYALIVLGGTKRQLRETLKYILVNIVSSTLFVAAVAYLYSVVGTLNMAHLAQRVTEVEQSGVLSVIAVLFLIVFALKAGLVLFQWLPGSYEVPPIVVIALFSALLTKVGMYSIIRLFSLVFNHDPFVQATLLSMFGVITMVLGAIGAIAYRDIIKILIYNIVIAIGFITFGLATMNQAGIDGAVYYLIHDMVVKGALFLLGGTIIYVAGTTKLDHMGGLVRRYPALAITFFIAAMGLVGVPPLSGFIGKLLIIEGGLRAQLFVMTAVGLGSSLLVLLSMLKIFIGAFFGQEVQSIQQVHRKNVRFLLVPSIILVAIVVLLGIGADYVVPIVEKAGEVLRNPDLYIQAVLKE